MKRNLLKHPSGMTQEQALVAFFSDAASRDEVRHLFRTLKTDKIVNATAGCGQWSPIIPPATETSQHND